MPSSPVFATWCASPCPGEVRLQYWRDLLEGSAHGETAANPVAAELLSAVQTWRLPVAPLVSMADARIFDLYDDPMETTVMFEGYAGETAAALIQLAALVLDAKAAEGAAEIVGHAGVAQAVAGAILLMPVHRARGQVYLPTQILSSVGLDREAFLPIKATGGQVLPSRPLPGSAWTTCARRAPPAVCRKVWCRHSCRSRWPSRC